MSTNYGEGEVHVGHYVVGAVRVNSVISVPAISPRIRFDLSWTLGHQHRSDDTDPADEYRLVGYGGDLQLGRNGPYVGTLQRSGAAPVLRSLPYVRAQQDFLVLDLDGNRFERLEEHRAGGALERYCQLGGA